MPGMWNTSLPGMWTLPVPLAPEGMNTSGTLTASRWGGGGCCRRTYWSVGTPGCPWAAGVKRDVGGLGTTTDDGRAGPDVKGLRHGVLDSTRQPGLGRLSTDPRAAVCSNLLAKARVYRRGWNLIVAVPGR
jgi:hypothetical protein